MTTAQQRQAIGAFGEKVAARHLTEERGMTLLERNWRCRAGEVDLLLRDGDTLVVCEVKTRRGTAYGDPLEAVTPEKHQRLRTIASFWMEWTGQQFPDVRIDLVGIDLGKPTAERIAHVVGAL
jgi:putative endonuclease